MTDTSCRRAGKDQPRVLRDRHKPQRLDHDTDDVDRAYCPGYAETDPRDDTLEIIVGCNGCLPCPRAHCIVCGFRHVDNRTCPECVGEARDLLDDIVEHAGDHEHADGRTSNMLLAQAIHTGLRSEAMNLAGPAANPDAYRQRRRHGYRNHPDDVLGEDHPLWTVAKWALLVADHYAHTRTTIVTVTSAADYLKRNLTDLAQDHDFAFDDLAGDLTRCATHLKVVLGDSDQGDRAGVGCFDCGAALARKLRDRKRGGPDDDRGGFEDTWTCTRQACGRRYTYSEYNFALRAHLERAQEGASA